MKKFKTHFFYIKQIHLFALLTVLFSLLSLFGQWHHLIELTSHFKLHYLLASLFFIGLYLIKKNYQLVAVFLLMVVLNSSYILPWYLAPESNHSIESSTRISLFHSNVYTSNNQYSKLIQVIKNELPDIVVLQEVDRLWIENLSEINELYPYQKIQTREDNFGIVLYSRLPITKSEIIYPGTALIPTIQVTILAGEEPIQIIATHPLPPISKSYATARNSQLESIANLIKSIKEPVVLIGDLNTTMWSFQYKELVEVSALINARKGFGIHATWPSQFLALGIPIDHLLYSREFILSDFRALKDIGSDHLPIMASLSLNTMKN